LIYQEKDGQTNAHEDERTLQWLVTMPLMIMLHEHVEGFQFSSFRRVVVMTDCLLGISLASEY
jgi:hypothetical protein